MPTLISVFPQQQTKVNVAQQCPPQNPRSTCLRPLDKKSDFWFYIFIMGKVRVLSTLISNRQTGGSSSKPVFNPLTNGLNYRTGSLSTVLETSKP